MAPKSETRKAGPKTNTHTITTKNLAKGRPEGPAKVPGSDGASPPSDPLSDLLTSPKDETGGSSYETEQELERLLVNPVHSMDNAPNFHAGAPLTIPHLSPLP